MAFAGCILCCRQPAAVTAACRGRLLLLLLLLGATLGGCVHQQRRLRLLGMLHRERARRKSPGIRVRAAPTATSSIDDSALPHAGQPWRTPVGTSVHSGHAASANAGAASTPQGKATWHLTSHAHCPRSPAGPWLLCSRAACSRLKWGSHHQEGRGQGRQRRRASNAREPGTCSCRPSVQARPPHSAAALQQPEGTAAARQAHLWAWPAGRSWHGTPGWPALALRSTCSPSPSSFSAQK